jgi:hypothetical protein
MLHSCLGKQRRAVGTLVLEVLQLMVRPVCGDDGGEPLLSNPGAGIGELLRRPGLLPLSSSQLTWLCVRLDPCRANVR